MKKEVLVTDLFRAGWKTFLGRKWFFIGISAVYIFVSAIPSIIENIEKSVAHIADDPLFTFLSLFVNIAATVLGFIIPIGYLYIMLQADDNGVYGWKDLFATKGVFWKFFFSWIINHILIVVGFALLVIPGVFLTVVLIFALASVIDEKIGPIQALKETYRLVKDVWLKMLLFSLAVFALNILGFFVFGVGLLVTMPVSALAVVHVYRVLKHKESELIVAPLSEVPETA